MTMLEGNYSDEGVSEMTRAERCRPDYETMIKRLREKMSKSVNFRDAALAYFEGKRARDKMAELIGELVTECNQFDRELANLRSIAD